MDLNDRCRLLLDRIADRLPPAVLAKARSYGAKGKWKAALMAVANSGMEAFAEEQDLINDLLDELAEAPKDVEPIERRREFVAHPSNYQYYVRDWDCDHDPETAPLEQDDLVSLEAARHLVHVHTGMYGFDLPLTVEILDAEPPADLTAWPEVSEVSALFSGDVLLVESILSGRAVKFPLPAGSGQARSYRVRVHAMGRAEAEEAVHVSIEHGDPLIERHLIQVWPAPVEPLTTWKP